MLTRLVVSSARVEEGSCHQDDGGKALSLLSSKVFRGLSNATTTVALRYETSAALLVGLLECVWSRVAELAIANSTGTSTDP